MADATLPSQRYADGVARGDWLHDPAQQDALAALDRVHAALLAAAPARSLVQRLFARDEPAPAIRLSSEADAANADLEAPEV